MHSINFTTGYWPAAKSAFSLENAQGFAAPQGKEEDRPMDNADYAPIHPAVSKLNAGVQSPT